MVMTAETFSDWEARLRGRSAGATSVEDVSVRRDFDISGESALVVDLYLSAPPAGADTWDTSEVRQLVSFSREMLSAGGSDSVVVLIHDAEESSATDTGDGDADDLARALDERAGGDR